MSQSTKPGLSKTYVSGKSGSPRGTLVTFRSSNKVCGGLQLYELPVPQLCGLWQSSGSIGNAPQTTFWTPRLQKSLHDEQARNFMLFHQDFLLFFAKHEAFNKTEL